MGNQRCDPQPAWKAKFFVGAPVSDAIVSSKGEILSCRDQAFEEFVCVHGDDLKKLQTEVLDKCERWKQ